jgi:DNA-binding winged helix-turn-helix (wHTH) protein
MPILVRDTFFAPFRLDAENGRLWNGASELAIRPKTLAVLRHLAEHAGQLVTVGDLVHAVWADSHGSAPLVKGCVREVRKLLGDDSEAPRYIETVGRRGYRFVAPIEDISTALDSSWASGHAGSTFVGRRAELGQLGACLEAALSGTRQILFLTGEPGVGKTTLAGHFLAAAATRHELRIARGQCVEQYGPGEPYLPVLQALATMCRGSGGDRVLDVLDRYAPMWLAQMPPLLSKAEHERLLARVAGANRERMLREMCDAVEAFAAERPLVLWLDDLQWSDPSTVDLLSSLALRAERARFLMLGAYRPADVVVSGHPLGAARRSLLASGQARELALAALSGADVQGYLARRFPANELPPALGAALLEITDGNPLFLSSLLDELVAQRVLAEEDGRWRLRKRMEALGDVLPDSLRHLIERQIERLSDEDQRILEAGSAAGREFSAGAVAAALGLDADAVDERLQALTRCARLVDARGLDSPPHRATSGRHDFVHALHQRVLYGRLSPARRARLHRRLGAVQETAWGDSADEIAAELALHFERGGDAPRAVRFLRIAAENAARRLAGTEAIAHLTRALGLVDRLARRDRPLAELRLQMALGLMLMNSRGHAAPEVDRTYRRAADLSERIGNRPGLYRMLWGLHRFMLIRADIKRALTLARKGVAMASKSDEQGQLLEAYVALGVTLFYAGQLAPARVALARGLRLRRAMPASSPAFRMLDAAIVIRAHLGFLAWLLGEEAEMLEHLAEMRREASALGQLLPLAYSHIGAAMLHQFARDADAVRAGADALLALSTEHGSSMFVAWARCFRGWALAVGSGEERGVDEIQAGIEQWQATGAKFMVPYQLGLLGDAQAAVGRQEAALGSVEDALAVARKTGERWWEPEILRLKGELLGGMALRARGARRVQGRRAALASLRKAVAIARGRGARALVHRARESLERLE